MRNFRQNRGVFSLFMLIGLAAIVAAIMLLWNYLIPSIIGWTTINYWQALGLFVLTRLLFGGFHGHGFMRPPGKPEHLHHLWGKVKNMSPEERRNYIRQRFEERQQVFNDDIFGEEKPKAGAYREVDGETHKVLQPFVHCSGFAFDMDFA